MSVLTERSTKEPRRVADPHTATEWLDALSTGACDEATFLFEVRDVVERAPDEGWELLALVDQYYRRGKITADAFNKLKSHLQDLLMGNARGEVSGPLYRTHQDSKRAVKAGPAPALETTAPRAPQPVPTATATPPPVVARPIPAAAASPVSAATATPPPVVARPMPAAAASPPPAPVAPEPWRANRSLAVGDVLRGRYRVQAMLGQGGMGTVFEAIDEYRLDRSGGDQRVAIKVLHTAIIQRPELFADLRREFQHLQLLSHPNIVRVHEFDRDGELAFFTMEYLSGALLTRVLFARESSTVSRPHAWAIIRDVGAAVAHAHARGVVHGDLNPGNIFITDDGEVRVLDFGASNHLRRGPWISEFESSQPVTVATPSYASCQVLEGQTADARDDIYALACIAYVLLTGNLPFREHTALKARTLRLKPKRPQALSRRQWNALREGLHFERDDRPPDLQAWLGRLDLQEAAPHLPVLLTLLTTRRSRQNYGRWIAAAAAAALILACAWWTTTHPDSQARLSAAVEEQLKSTFSNGPVSRMWDKLHQTIVDARGARSVTTTPEASTTPPRTAPPSAPIKPPPRTSSASGSSTSSPSSGDAPNVITESTREIATPAAVANSPVTRAPAPAQGSYPVHARVELAADNVDVLSNQQVAHVVVRRSRTLRGDVTFNWWTESGTAKPGRDFVAVKSHVEHIEDGQAAADLAIPVLADPLRRDSRSFYVVIDEASDNAALGPRTLTMVTLPGSE